MSGPEASKILGPHLWDYEKTEILDFETVYFFNTSERIKQQNMHQVISQRNQSQSQVSGATLKMGVLENGPNIYNHGFDNEQQEYIIVMNEHIAYRYELVKKIGKGSFGTVLRAFDHKTKEFVALKILKN